MIEEKSIALDVANATTLPKNPVVRSVCKKLKDIKGGRLFVTLPDGETIVFGEEGGEDLKAHVILKSYKPLSRFIVHGDLGWAESYMDGEWDCPDLTALFKIALINEQDFSLKLKGGWFKRNFNRVRHFFNANSKRGSKRNISYHYDLGNNFYEKWLDETMTYSSALFKSEQESLSEAQLRKYRTIADMAHIQPGESVLEVGCGWGGFSEIAAKEYGAHVHGLTLSKEQLQYALSRYDQGGVSALANASLTDYRDANGQYDKIVSIEMFEAVGEENWPAYFDMINDRLKPGGTAVLQVILIEDHRFESYRQGVDFIQRYIFPGGMLPSQEMMSRLCDEHGLKLDEKLLFGSSYSRTCNIWQKRFQRTWKEIKPMGFDDRFKRMWEYYLSYCEAGFYVGTVDVGLFKIVKPS